MFDKAIEMVPKAADLYRALTGNGLPEDVSKDMTVRIWADFIAHETPLPPQSVNVNASIKEENNGERP